MTQDINNKCLQIEEAEFKRIVLHLRGTLVGYNENEKPDIFFVTEDDTIKVKPTFYEVVGNKFHIMLNVLSCNNQYPMENGIYYLKAMDNNNLSGAYMTNIDKYNFDAVRDGKINLYMEHPGGSSVDVRFYPDLDTNEFCIEMNSILMEIILGPKYYLRQFKDKLKAFLSGISKWSFVQIYKMLSKFRKTDGNIILFTSASRASLSGNEEFIYNRMVERGLDKDFKFRFDFKASINERRNIFKKFKFVYYLATSNIILIDDFFPEIYKNKYPKDVKVVQVWHACGAFKTLGLERLGKDGSPSFNTRVHKCYTHVPVSSVHSAFHHAEGFGLSLDKFYPIGIPRTDIFFDEEYKKKTLEHIYSIYPTLEKANKVYLYAPTFRGINARNASFPFNKVDLNKWGEFLKKNNSMLIIKMHPFVKEHMVIPEEYKEYIIDAGDYREVNDLLFAVDVLITDYSSVIYEFSLLKRPMVFYAFDQRMYEAKRDFYEKYEDTVPGKIVKTFDDLMLSLENEDYEFHKMDGFIKKNFTYTDGKSTDRFIDQIILDKK